MKTYEKSKIMVNFDPRTISSSVYTTLKDLKNRTTADNYLGLTGLGLQLAQEFAFWANAIYHDVGDV